VLYSEPFDFASDAKIFVVVIMDLPSPFITKKYEKNAQYSYKNY
jgi:hypothetical protein